MGNISRIRIGLSAQSRFYFCLARLNQHPIISKKTIDHRIEYFDKGIFRSENAKFMAFDNSTNELWTEEFETINEAFRWLNNEH